MAGEILEFIRKYDTIPVSPIWGGEQVFHFLCLGHLDISKALGFELFKVTDSFTIVKEGQLRTSEEVDRIIEKGEFDYGSFRSELENLRNMKQLNPDGMCGGGCFGPLTVASGIFGAEYMLKKIAKDPDTVERFVAYITEYMIELAQWETEAGGEFFWIAEPLASLLSPENSWRFSGKYLKKIYDAAKVPGLLHVCGKTLKHTPYLERTGAQLLSIDYCTDIGECIRMVDEKVVIMGNVNPSTLRFGSKEDVEEEVRAILSACEGFTNFVLSTGCSIMDNTPDENMQVLFDMVENKNR